MVTSERQGNGAQKSATLLWTVMVAMPLAVVASAPVVDASCPQNSSCCNDGVSWGPGSASASCSFSCSAQRYLTVGASAEGGYNSYSATASCGGASVTCSSSPNGCLPNHSASPTGTAGSGTCTGFLAAEWWHWNTFNIYCDDIHQAEMPESEAIAAIVAALRDAPSLSCADVGYYTVGVPKETTITMMQGEFYSSDTAVSEENLLGVYLTSNACINFEPHVTSTINNPGDGTDGDTEFEMYA